jgi:copper transport protein
MSAARALLFAGLLGGAGGVLFLALVLPDGVRCEGRIRVTVSAFAAGGCAAAVLAMGVQGGLLLNGTAASFGEPATWRMGIGSFYGRTATAALIGLALVIIGLRTKTALRPLAWLGAAIALGGFGLSGHVVTSGPRWLTIPTLIAHTSAAAFWAGSLLPLWQVIRSNERVAPAVVERFSRLAVVAVGVLLVAGTIIAVLQVRSPGALLTTGYGLALTVKLALVAGLIALAAWNKLRLTPALGRRKASARRAMQKTIVTEMACVFAILVATGVVGTRAPPRVLAEGAAHAAHAGGSVETGLALTIIQEKRSADIVLASAWSGVNRARIALRDADGTPVEAHEVMLIASNPGAGVEPIERIAERAEDGTWRVDDLLLAPPGRWTLRLDVLINDFEKAILETRTDLLNRQPPPASGS